MANLPPKTPALSPQEFAKFQEKFPDRIPVFVLRGAKIDPSFPHLSKNKFLVPKCLTLGMFSYVVRKQLTLAPEKALFLFVGNTLPTTGTLMSELYHMHKSPDGALRMTYMSESAFGAAD
jgi:GABA(A) receptor-associated protein